MTDLIANGESGASVRAKLNGVAANQQRLSGYDTPQAANTIGGDFFISGTGSDLPAGSDAAAGTAAAPFATVSYATSQIPSAGNKRLLASGSFTANDSGRWIPAKAASLTSVFDSYSGVASGFLVTNTSGTNGVINIRSSAAARLQWRRMTLQSSTEGNSLFRSEPTSAGNIGVDLGFYDCVFEAKTHSTTIAAVLLRNTSDYGIDGLTFSNVVFKRIAGTSTTAEPTVILTQSYTSTVDNQPNQRLGFYGCRTDGAFAEFATDLSGVDGLRVYNCDFAASGHAFLTATDSSDLTRPKVTDVEVCYNRFTAIGDNAHGTVLGANTLAPLYQWNRVYSTAQGIVTKGSLNAQVLDCDVVCVASGVTSGSALYPKASVGTTFDRVTATVDGTAGTTVAFREGGDGANKASNSTLKNCTLHAKGASATALIWGASADSTGGATSDYNDYILEAGAALGSVRGVTVTTLAELQAAWASSGLAGDNPLNDAHSTVTVIA